MRRLLLMRHVRGFCIKMKKTRKTSRRRAPHQGIRGNEDLSERLPLELILKHLPLQQRVRAMSVCKAWNHILHESVVANLEQMQKGPWLLMSCYDNDVGWKFLAYDVETGELTQPPGWLPSGFNGGAGTVAPGLLMGCMCESDNLLWNEEFFGDLQSPRIASSGGLMCALLVADKDDHIFGNVVVFNCLTSSVKVLPPPLRSDLLFGQHDIYSDLIRTPCPCHIYMATDELDPTHYYVMLSRVDKYLPYYVSSSDRHTEVFDSERGVWIDATIWKDFDSIDVDSILRHVWDGNFFFIQESRDGIFHLVAYDVVHDAWSTQLLSTHCSYLMENHKSFCVHKFKGRIFLAFCSNWQNHFRIWEVRQANSSAAIWVETACSPLSFLNDVRGRISKGSSISIHILTCKNCFYFVVDVDNHSAHEMLPLVYDIATDCWYSSPPTNHSNYDVVLVHQPSWRSYT